MQYNNLRRFFFILILLIFPALTQGQVVDVNSSSVNIKEKNIRGFVVCLELDTKSIESNWSQYLKSLGKFEKVEKQTIEGVNLIIPAISADAVDFYSKITVNPRCVQVFMGASRAGSALDIPEEQKVKIRSMLYEFALEQYRMDLKKQISEAERVVNLAVKAHDKRTNESNSIKNKITRNKKERVRLMQDLEENAKNMIKLKADSVQNFSELETALEEIKKVRQIAEDKKVKLSQVK